MDKNRIIKSAVFLLLGLFVFISGISADEEWYLDTPSGYQGMGGGGTLGPYSSESECESVNSQYFNGMGDCYCTSGSSTENDWDWGWGSDSGNTYGNSTYAPPARDDSWYYRQQEQIDLQRQAEGRRRQERIKKKAESEKQLLKEQEKEKTEFLRKKSELTASLKGASASTGPKTLKPDLKLKTYYPSPPPENKNIIVQGSINGYEKAKQNFINWTYSSTFEMAFGKIPGVKYLKEIYDEYKEMQKEMKELNMNILQYAMKGVQDGVNRSASLDLSDSGLSDEYEKGRGNLFGKTAIKVRELLKKKIED